MDIEERETLKTYLLNLRYEIGQTVVASDPKNLNLNLAQQLVADREQWLRETNRVANRPKNQSNNSTPVSKRNATDPQPRTFSQPSGDRTKLNCSKCSRIGHSRDLPLSKFSIRQPRKDPTSSKTNNGESKGSLPRVNCTTTERILSIVLQRRNGGRARFLIVSGAGINFIKEKASLNIQTSNPKSFLVGNDKHTTNKICNLTMLKKNYRFHVVPDSFPLIEDGIIGLPFLTKDQYSVTNNKLMLDEIILPFQKTDSKIRPGETLTSTQYIEGKPTVVCFINTGKQICHITNETEKPDKLSQINKFAEIIRTKHIDPELREPLEKILINSIISSGFHYITMEQKSKKIYCIFNSTRSLPL